MVGHETLIFIANFIARKHIEYYNFGTIYGYDQTVSTCQYFGYVASAMRKFC
jgi:hypothetical protein